jgi:DNA replication protein DnaC
MSDDLPASARSHEQDACLLGLCDGSGFVIDEASNTATDCRCREARVARVRTRSLAGRIPKKYRGVSFDRPPVPEISRVAPDQVNEVRRYVRNVDSNIDAGRGLWLMGEVGTGKTTLAMIVSKAALDAGRSVAIYSLPRLLNLMRSAIATEAGMIGFLERLTAVDLLHIDDLGAESTTEWVLEQLYSIINSRYEDERAMILTSNLTYDDLVVQLGARTVSRLVAICGNFLPLYGQDDRRLLQDRRQAAPETAHLA